MKLNRIRSLAGLHEAEDVMQGTNCANCKYTKDQKVVKIENEGEELNQQGGTVPENDEQMKMAKEGDLITMPGHKIPDSKVWCHHKKIHQYVTNRMCCAYWDAPGTLRAYGKQEVGQ